MTQGVRCLGQGYPSTFIFRLCNIKRATNFHLCDLHEQKMYDRIWAHVWYQYKVDQAS